MLWISGYLTITLGALFSTYFYPDLLSILHSQKLSVQPYVLPKSDLGVQTRTSELSWKQELAPPHLSRLQKPDIQSDLPDDKLLEFKKLWKPPSNRGFVPCVDRSPSYTGPAKSRGYLVVQSNGGLNQMRAGVRILRFQCFILFRCSWSLTSETLCPDGVPSDFTWPLVLCMCSYGF
jgi:hypothetical protein